MTKTLPIKDDEADQRDGFVHGVGARLFDLWMPSIAIVITIFLFPLMITKKSSRFACKIWARLALWGLRLFCGIDHHIMGQEYMPRGRALVAVKHQSMWETVALTIFLPNPVFVLKKELIDIPVFGWWARASGAVAVDRSAGLSALKKMTAEAQQAMGPDTQLIIFPEGTRVAVDQREKYQPGVYALYQALGAPCVPVAHNAGLFWHRSSKKFRPGTISIEFLPPIEGDMNRRQFIAQLQAEIDDRSERLAAAAVFPAGQHV